MKSTESTKDLLQGHDPISEVKKSSIENTPKQVNKETGDTGGSEQSDTGLLSDIDNLTKTQLREAYSSEYGSWRNMKQRRKKKGAIIDSAFEDFGDFLRHVGRRPSKNFTLDRIDNDNLTYGPNLVRWADKKTQNNNKSNSVLLTDADGTTKPLTEWAEITGQKMENM